MVADVVFGQPVQFGGIPHFDSVNILLYMLGKGEGDLRGFIGELTQVGSRCVILIDARQAVVQQRVAHIVRGSRVG